MNIISTIPIPLSDKDSMIRLGPIISDRPGPGARGPEGHGCHVTKVPVWSHMENYRDCDLAVTPRAPPAT
eukprot:3714374-Rhodomonas_salina.1